MNIFRPALCGLVISLLSAVGTAQDARRGELLYKNHCNDCHDQHVHLRGKSQLHDPAQVRAYVDTWQREINLAWSDDDIDDVLVYLGERYYGFVLDRD